MASATGRTARRISPGIYERKASERVILDCIKQPGFEVWIFALISNWKGDGMSTDSKGMDAKRPVLNIAGERVALGPLRDEHFDAIARWENDYGTVRYFTAPGPRRPEDTRSNFTDGDFSGPTNVVFALYEAASWRFIGIAGLIKLDHLNSTAEFFILIGPADARGKGYGTEATCLVLDHAFLSLGLASVRLGVFSFNPAAVRAYEKAGFKRAGTLRRNKLMGGKLWDTILMDAVADEFESPVLARVLVSDEPRLDHRRHDQDRMTQDSGNSR
jgi:RimJ/RimL family protein N-acetyltransferase